MSNYLINYDSSLISFVDIFEPYTTGTQVSSTNYRDNSNNDLNTLFAPYVIDTSMAIQTNYYTYQSSVKKDLNEVFKAITVFPVGHIMIWPSSNPPINYLLADGTSYNITSYPELYNAIGITYGGSDSTFNVPNMNQKAMPYYDANNNINYGSFGGATNVTLNANQLPVHTHTLKSGDATIFHSHVAVPDNANFVSGFFRELGAGGGDNKYVVRFNPSNINGNGYYQSNFPMPSSTNANVDTTFTFNSNQTGGTTNNSPGSFNIQNPYIVINYVIKYQ